MIVTSMRRPSHNTRARRARWLAALAFAAVTPKCLLCLAAYAGIGATWLGAPELCGAAQREPSAWTLWWPLFAAATAALGFFARAGTTRPRSPAVLIRSTGVAERAKRFVLRKRIWRNAHAFRYHGCESL